MRLALLALPLAVLACSPEGGETDGIELNPPEVMTDAGLYMVHLTPSSDPFVAGEEVSLMLHVRQDGADVEGAMVSAEPFMPDMGHGIPDAPAIVEDGMGMYTATWTFTMAGYWEVELMVDGSAGMDHATVAYEVE